MSPNQVSPARDYKAEAKAKKGTLAFGMAEVKEARMRADRRELMQVAQVMCIFGLPYRKPDDRFVVRSGRAANGDSISVTFQAMVQGVDLPYGSDRSLLHWMTHRAVLTKSPFIPISSASQYLRDMGMSTAGKNIRRVREAFERIASFALVVQRRSLTGEKRLITPLVRSANMPRGMRTKAQMSLPSLEEQEEGFLLDEGVFRELMEYNVPTLAKLIEVTRESPQIQDCMLFLQWRSFAARTDSLIPWSSLREQLGSEDSNPYRIKTRFAEAIEALKVPWPAINAQALKDGLLIGPHRRVTSFYSEVRNPESCRGQRFYSLSFYI